MNPILLFYILLVAFLIWGLLAKAFPTIGNWIKGTKDGMDEMMEEKDEDE